MGIYQLSSDPAPQSSTFDSLSYQGSTAISDSNSRRKGKHLFRMFPQPMSRKSLKWIIGTKEYILSWMFYLRCKLAMESEVFWKSNITPEARLFYYLHLLTVRELTSFLHRLCNNWGLVDLAIISYNTLWSPQRVCDSHPSPVKERWELLRTNRQPIYYVNNCKSRLFRIILARNPHRV